jgi:gamma-glutamyltranspeptidase/glutathione hydrolase
MFRSTLVTLTALAATLAWSQPARTMRPVVRGTRYAVTAMKPEAAVAAQRILEAGGNAFDAIVAGQAVLAIVDAPMNGVGSDAVILIWDARARQVVSIDAEGTAPALATIEWYNTHHAGTIPNSDGLLSATVPGVVDAWYLLLDRWGSMSFEQVLAPAIELAERGFPIGDTFARAIRSTAKIRKYPTSRALYFPNGRAPEPGDIFRNPNLARTLRRLVEAERAALPQGRRAALLAARDRFYKGDIAREMAAFSEANGGLFRYQDFARYHARFETPVSTTYRGYQVFKNASSNQGPTELIALNLLEGFDLKTLGHNSAPFLHLSAEALKLAMADREKYLGDASFVEIPFAGLLSKEYARQRRKLIDPTRASFELRPGAAESFLPGHPPLDRPLDYQIQKDADHEGDTSYLNAADAAGNIVSFEPSLHSAFGTGVVMGDLGFIFNCRGDYFSLKPGTANALAPAKRPRSTLQSTLVLKDGRPFLATGSPGGDDQVMRTLQTLLNIVDFGMNVQQAIEAPRWTTRAFPGSSFPHVMIPGDLGVEDRIPENVRKELRLRGHKLTVTGPWRLGSNSAILIDPVTGVYNAGTDPRVEAWAVAR